MQTVSETASTATCTHGGMASAPCPFTQADYGDDEGAAEAAIATWLFSRDAEDFPYDIVVTAFHRVGKHLVPTTLLEGLAVARTVLPGVRGSVMSLQLLDRFLDAALDKWDGRYANPTYLALSLLPLATIDDLGRDFSTIERQYDRLLVQLIMDASRFEIAAAEGATDLLPEMRPDAETTAKRCRLGLQVTGPAARRLALDDGVDVANPIAGARRLWANLKDTLLPAEDRTLQLTMLPVSVIHDEYQFIRILQAFEATFALIAVQLHEAIRELVDGACDAAIQRIHSAAATLHEAAPLFSLVATMRVEAFETFRIFTEGASAIQSRNYKLVESLCRQPDRSRLDSAAYLATPEVRQSVLAGQMTLDDAIGLARTAGHLDAHDEANLEQAMRQFAATLVRWRRTHHSIAVRMLGERTGTGYTEGASYLKAVQAIPVFMSLAESEVDEKPASVRATSAQPRNAMSAGGRCPFAGTVVPAVSAVGD